MKKTPLYDAHLAAGGKLVEFAGYQMPVQYEGLAAEHSAVRSSAGLFDVSHMGQAILEGEGAGDFLSFITPSPFAKTPIGKAKYTVLTNEDGGIIDDLIITRIAENRFFLVLNAARKEVDVAWLRKHLTDGLTLTEWPDKALLALQGPKAEAALQPLVQEPLAEQDYMSLQVAHLADGTEIFVSRLGYTGEDGFEISIDGAKAPTLWNALLAHDAVSPAGLGARDTLRLEMGYPLYGHDLNEEISPIEANLGWVVSKQNRKFMGAARILKEIDNQPTSLRMGIRLLEKGVAREGTKILSGGGAEIGEMTSGGMSPTLGKAIGQGYIKFDYAKKGEKVTVEVRGRAIAAEICGLSFIEAKTKPLNKKVA